MNGSRYAARKEWLAALIRDAMPLPTDSRHEIAMRIWRSGIVSSIMTKRPQASRAEEDR